MTTDPPSFFTSASAGYRQQLEQALSSHLEIVQGHAAGQTLTTPWEFEAALVAVRHIADELRRITLDEEPVPF